MNPAIKALLADPNIHPAFKAGLEFLHPQSAQLEAAHKRIAARRFAAEPVDPSAFAGLDEYRDIETRARDEAELFREMCDADDRMERS